MIDIKNDLLEQYKDLQFEENNHIYTLNDEILPSVSKLCKSFYKPFDKNIAKYIAGKGKYIGMNEMEILNQWEEKAKKSREIGTSVHLFGENYPFDKSLIPNNELEIGIKQFIDDLPDFIIPLICELRTYNKKYKYAGTIDLILLNTSNNKLIIADYKTNEDLFKVYKNNKLLYPFDFHSDNDFNKYQIQLNHYDLNLKDFNFEVDKKLIIWLTNNESVNKKYKILEVEDLTQELIKYYDNI